MSSFELIGMLGAKRSGKDTCADYLVEHYGYTKVAFADPLKRACKELFLLSEEQLNGSLKEVPDNRWYGATPRQMFQFVGTELLRKNMDKIMPGIGEDIFVDYFKQWYQSNPGIKVVVSDVRLTNEFNMIHELGGKVIKISRPSVEQFSTDSHITEHEYKTLTPDFSIINDSDKNNLFTLLRNIITY